MKQYLYVTLLVLTYAFQAMADENLANKFSRSIEAFNHSDRYASDYIKLIEKYYNLSREVPAISIFPVITAPQGSLKCTYVHTYSLGSHSEELEVFQIPNNGIGFRFNHKQSMSSVVAHSNEYKTTVQNNALKVTHPLSKMSLSFRQIGKHILFVSEKNPNYLGTKFTGQCYVNAESEK